MVAFFLLKNVWFDLLLWVAIYASDYYLTIYQMGLYRKDSQGHVHNEGGLELNPYFQADVDRQRKFSLRWLLMASITSLLLFFCWWLSVKSIRLPGFFWCVLGMLYLLEAAVHVRHITNIVLFQQILRGETSGRIEYSRKASMLTSAGQFLGFALLFFLCFLLTSQWFFMGGALGCGSTGLNHYFQAKKLRARLSGTPSTGYGAPPPASNP